MAKTVDKLAAEIQTLPDAEKLYLLDMILKELHKPNPETDGVWAEEARKRWTVYKTRQIPTVDYNTVIAKHRKS